jgi:hypothetical protein
VRIISDEGLPSAPSRDQIDETLENVVLGSKYESSQFVLYITEKFTRFLAGLEVK